MDNHKRLSGGTVLWMTALVFGISALHLTHLPGNVVAFFLLTVLARVLLTGFKITDISVWLLGGISIAGMALVVSSYGALLGRGPGVALLVTMTALKLLELKTTRDVIMLSFLGYFLAATQFLYSQGIGISLAMGFAALALTATLIHVHQAKPHGYKKPAKSALRLFAQAIPMMLILYVIFPRTGPIWQIGVDTGTAMTGLSNRLEPGSIAELVQSKATAFTVKFIGSVPENRDRYFRGPIFEKYKNDVWEAAKPRLTSGNPIPLDDEEIITQEIVMEPSGQHYMFGLETPITTPTGVKRTVAGQLVSSAPIREQKIYTVQSSQRVFGEAPRRDLLQLPKVSEKVLELARSLKKATEKETIASVLEHFASGGYVYSLQPGRSSGDRLEYFLFDNKKGFCEQYSTSYVILLRAAGIPARVVGGYQGGEWNPVAGVLKVRQADAHAWAEVWIEDQGWVRIDPTAVVAPERIEQTVNVVDGSNGAAISFSLNLSGLKELWQQVGWMADGIHFSWRRWVVDFDESTQKEIWQALGLSQLKKSHVVLFGITAVLSLLVVATLVSLRGAKKTALDRLKSRLLDIAQRYNVENTSADGAITVLKRLSEKYPSITDIAARFADGYVQARYRQLSVDNNRELRHLLKQLDMRLRKDK